MTDEQLIRRIRQLTRQMEKRSAQNKFDAQEVLRLVSELEQRSGRRCPNGRSTSNNGRNDPDPHEGANRVLLRDEPGIGTVVNFDDFPLALELRNRKVVEALLIELAAPHSATHGAANGLVPFKTKEELIAGIERRTGHKIDETILRNHVRRLRRLMMEAELDRAFVETCKGGYRLRLKAEGAMLRRGLDGKLRPVSWQ